MHQTGVFQHIMAQEAESSAAAAAAISSNLDTNQPEPSSRTHAAQSLAHPYYPCLPGPADSGRCRNQDQDHVEEEDKEDEEKGNSSEHLPPFFSSRNPVQAASLGLLGPLARSLRQQRDERRNTPARPSRQVKQLVDEWASEISRHGLTSASVVRDRSSKATVGSDPRREQSGASYASTHGGGEGETKSSLHARRRRRSCEEGPTYGETGEERHPGGLGEVRGERASRGSQGRTGNTTNGWKKPRIGTPGSLELDSLRRYGAISGPPPKERRLSSPIFSSARELSIGGAPRQERPSTPRDVDSMNNRIQDVQDDPEPFTTYQLARGNVATASPPVRSSSSPGGSSVVVGTTSSNHSLRTSDGRSLPPHLLVLQNIGIVELLEQDERPTFIVDLTNAVNVNAGQLDIVFANAALRASGPILSSLSPDTSSDPAVAIEFDRFKAWVVFIAGRFGGLHGHDASGPARFGPAPPLSYGGITWTHSTLRRRFRVVSGNSTAHAITPTSPFAVTRHMSAVDEERARGPTFARDPNTPHERMVTYHGDYFAGARVNSPTPLRQAQQQMRHSPEALPDRADNDSEHGVGMVTDRAPSGAPEGGLPLTETSGAIITSTFDWTRIEVTPSLSPHIRFARSIDWGATPLGPIETWPADLRTMSNLIMGSPHPSAMYWGHDNITIYNEAYIRLAGQKHPRIMGMPYRMAWGEIWDQLEPVIERCWSEGESIMKHDDQLFIVRNNFLEETFFNWSLIPLMGGDGQVVALYNPAFENTRRKVNERRMLTLREIGEKTQLCGNIKIFWEKVLEGLEYNQFDVPLVLIYSVPDDGERESEVSSLHSANLANPPTVTLEGSHGVPKDHPAAAPRIDLRTCDEGFAPYMREAMAHSSGAPVVLSKEAGTLPPALIEGLEWRGFGDPCHTIVVFPVHLTTSESVVAFIVMGTNPRRPYNADYELFVQLLSRQLTTSMASVVLIEEEIRRSQRAARRAAMDREELSMQLHLRTQEAVESEYKFTRMAEYAPVGIFITNGQGHLTYCNDKWWEISRHPRWSPTAAVAAAAAADSMADSWMQSIKPEDRAGVEDVWRRLVEERTAVTHEFRFKSPSIIDSHRVDTWVLMSAFPERAIGGEIKRIFGCMTDISQQKWAETFQRQRREEAVELKRQQENFIDMTSHEMRNPLSAILQCADEIANGLSRWKTRGGLKGLTHFMSAPCPESLAAFTATSPTTTTTTAATSLAELNSLVDGSIEAANTIALCASHQKRIVDDILTFSKLDSALLLVTPIDSQPVATVQNVLKMFEPELRSSDIYLEFRIERSFRELAIEWVKIDPSRLRQVLINLVTNAIKFTTTRDDRAIVVSLGAARDLGDGAPPAGLDYFPISRKPGGAGGNGTRRARTTATSGDGPDTTTTEYPKEGYEEEESLTDRPEWGLGEKIYLIFAVTDTGPGLTDKEKKVLFQRFSQATPRTHVQYGGSGLGLYICRTLSELQGGQISVTSSKGSGSTFAFYIKARKVHLDNLSPSTVIPPANSPFGPPQAQAPAAIQSQMQVVPAGADGDGAIIQFSIGSSAQPAAAQIEPTEAVAAAGSAEPSSPGAKDDRGAMTGGPATVFAPLAATLLTGLETPSRPGTPAGGGPKMLPLDVLIVEDNLVNQRVLQRQLNRCGNNTLVANHGGEALETLQRSRFWRSPVPSPATTTTTTAQPSADDSQSPSSQQGSRPKPLLPGELATTSAESLASVRSSLSSSSRRSSKPKEVNINISVILMDLEMPVMDGMTCARRIRELEAAGTIVHHIPIIAVTAYARPEQIETAKAAGIDDVISKPFRIPELIPKIEELVARFNTRLVAATEPQPPPPSPTPVTAAA